MAKYTPRQKAALSAKIVEAYHEGGQKGSVADFKRLLGTYAAHLSEEQKKAFIEEFEKHAAALRESLRKK